MSVSSTHQQFTPWNRYTLEPRVTRQNLILSGVICAVVLTIVLLSGVLTHSAGSLQQSSHVVGSTNTQYVAHESGIVTAHTIIPTAMVMTHTDDSAESESERVVAVTNNGHTITTYRKSFDGGNAQQPQSESEAQGGSLQLNVTLENHSSADSTGGFSVSATNNVSSTRSSSSVHTSTTSTSWSHLSSSR